MLYNSVSYPFCSGGGLASGDLVFAPTFIFADSGGREREREKWSLANNGQCRMAKGEVTWLPDGYSQIFRIVCVWPFGLPDYGSAMLPCKIWSLPFLGLRPHTLHPGARKGRDQILPSGNTGRSAGGGSRDTASGIKRPKRSLIRDGIASSRSPVKQIAAAVEHTGLSKRKVAKLRESFAWLRLAGPFFLHKPEQSRVKKVKNKMRERIHSQATFGRSCEFTQPNPCLFWHVFF